MEKVRKGLGFHLQEENKLTFTRAKELRARRGEYKPLIRECEDKYYPKKAQRETSSKVNCSRALPTYNVRGYALQARSCFAVLIVCAVVQGLEQKYLLWPLFPVFMSAPHSRQTEPLVFAVKNQSHLIMVGGVFKRVSVA